MFDGSRNGTSIPKAVARCFGIQSIKAWWHILTNANNIQLCLRKNPMGLNAWLQRETQTTATQGVSALEYEMNQVILGFLRVFGDDSCHVVCNL